METSTHPSNGVAADRAERARRRVAPVTYADVGKIGDGGVRILALGGELDLAAAPVLRGELEAALEGRPKRVVVDLRDVRLLDASSLLLLLHVRDEVVSYGGRFALAAARGSARRVLERTGLAGLLDMRRTLEDAVAWTAAGAD